MRRLATRTMSCANETEKMASSVCSSSLGIDTPLMMMVGCSITQQRRELRNLHQYPTARHKSLVRERMKYSRNWHMSKGNNYELVETSAHEREAFENFAIYKYDDADDKYILSTSKLEALPAEDRLGALTMMMKERWRVKDGNRGFDKAKMMLMALECYSEMRALGRIPVFEEMLESDQDMFLQFTESCCQFARRCVHSHPDAVAMMIRTASICDELRCSDKRDEVLSLAERTANTLGKALAYERVDDEIRLPKPLLEDIQRDINERNSEELVHKYPQLFVKTPGHKHPTRIAHSHEQRNLSNGRFVAKLSDLDDRSFNQLSLPRAAK